MENQLAKQAPWCIFRRISSGYQMCIGRLKTRSECEKHLKSLRKIMPNAQLEMVFCNEDLKKENSTPQSNINVAD